MSKLYVIGDAQGQVSLMEEMFEQLYDKVEKEDTIIVLGNYLFDVVGKNNIDMIFLLQEAKKQFKDQLVVLRGKTENLLFNNRKVLFDNSFGKNLIISYRGLKKDKISNYTTGLYRDKMLKGLDPVRYTNNVKWLFDNTVKFYETDNYFVCSSGIDPEHPLDNQKVNSLMFIEDKFIAHKDKFEKMIVHGTSFSDKVQVKSNRINVNTSPSTTNTLACVVLDDVKGEFEDMFTVKHSDLKAA